MRLKLIIVLAAVAGFLAMTFACGSSKQGSAAFIQDSNAQANSNAAANSNNGNSNTTPTVMDGFNPPHAVDIDGNPIPPQSATQPKKPIILGKDIKDPSAGELMPEAAFDHTKHTTDVKYSQDGKTVTECVYCHHTDQPMPVEGKPYLKKSERSEKLTAEELASSNKVVSSCRVCHFSQRTPPAGDYPPDAVTYPDGKRFPPTGKLTNYFAYHSKCINCHSEAKKARRAENLKAPTGCYDCHVEKD